MTWKTSFKICIAIIIAAVCVVFVATRYRSRAETKQISITSIEDFKAYEKLDREQTMLQIQFNLKQNEKMAIRQRLNVPQDFIEKREDANNPQSPVIGFVEKPHE